MDITDMIANIISIVHAWLGTINQFPASPLSALSILCRSGHCLCVCVCVCWGGAGRQGGGGMIA